MFNSPGMILEYHDHAMSGCARLAKSDEKYLQYLEWIQELVIYLFLAYQVGGILGWHPYRRGMKHNEVVSLEHVLSKLGRIATNRWSSNSKIAKKRIDIRVLPSKAGCCDWNRGSLAKFTRVQLNQLWRILRTPVCEACFGVSMRLGKGKVGTLTNLDQHWPTLTNQVQRCNCAFSIVSNSVHVVWGLKRNSFQP